MTTLQGDSRPPLILELPNERARKPYVGRWISGVFLVVIVAIILNAILNNKNISLPIIGQFLFDSRVLDGVVGTIALAILSFIGAAIVGVLIGYGRMSTNPVVRIATWLYVWFFRSVPLLVLVLIFGNLALFLPRLGVGVPFTSTTFWSVDTNKVMIPFVAGCVALALEQGAYLAEVVRSGIGSVPDSQREAAASLGMSSFEIQRKVVLPQAIPVMLPPAGNVLIMLVKSTSLIFTIGGTELLGTAEQIASANFRTMELLFVASLWYLVLTSLASIGQRYFERRFSAYRTRVVAARGLDDSALAGVEGA